MKIVFIFFLLIHCSDSEKPSTKPVGDLNSPTPIRTLKPIKSTVYVPSAPVCEGTIYECLVGKNSENKGSGQTPSSEGSPSQTGPSGPLPLYSCEGNISECVADNFSWLVSADTENAHIRIENNGVIWINGTWKSGDWYGDVWQDGTWEDGVWHKGIWENGFWHTGLWKLGTWNGGIWNAGLWKSGTWNKGFWNKGVWEDGIWNGGTWIDGVWWKGIWVDGRWYNGVWQDGIWENGIFFAGIWKRGTWKNGTWWYHATWRKGIWEKGSIYKWDKDKSRQVQVYSESPPLGILR